MSVTANSVWRRKQEPSRRKDMWSAAKGPTLAGEWESYFQSVSCGMTEVSNAG